MVKSRVQVGDDQRCVVEVGGLTGEQAGRWTGRMADRQVHGSGLIQSIQKQQAAVFREKALKTFCKLPARQIMETNTVSA